jgi:acyl-CoA thioesterase YciA
MSSISTIHATPTPSGKLALQTIAMPAHTNANGDIFAGWLVKQMDLAGFITSIAIARGRVVTVAVDQMQFLTAVPVGAVISCYTTVIELGRSSLRIKVEVWINPPKSQRTLKVTEGQFTFVAIDDKGSTRHITKVTG